ncbi:MAG: DUF3667 domain-containing protein [Cyclobacteriaceae bacterium]
MRIRRKTEACANCGLGLDQIYNYCPRCGQENNNRIVSFGELVRDFFLNYFSFDTKFVRSIRPFLLQPGKLTLLFIEGKRASYVNPLRLYIIVSVIFFFVSTLWIKESARVVSDSSNKEVSVEMSEALDKEKSENTRLFGSGIITFKEILEDESLTDQQAMDSLKQIGNLEWDSTSFIGPLVFSQMRKVARQDLEIFLAYVMQNMPVMMFLLLPVYALLLKLLYIRSRILYVKHLIHGVHLHAFTFILLTILLLIPLLFAPNVGFGNWIQLIILALLLIYIYASILRVYGQGWLKTLLKFSILGFFYFFVLLVFGFAEAIISFLIF